MDIKDALLSIFTDDPINWIKWAFVFAVLIGSYIIIIPLFKKVDYRLSWERKRDIAMSRNHIIKATLVRKWPSGEVANYDWHATYRYNALGKEMKYKAYFKHPTTPPMQLNLYYINNPAKLFSFEEYHYENHKAIILLPVMFLPWILACIALVLLRVDISGF